MSQDEQMAAIGRLMTGRAEAKRELALLFQQIRASAEKIAEVGSTLRYNLDGRRRVRPALDMLIKEGGLDKFAELLDRYEEITVKIADLEGTAKAAGIDF
jgi:hypothetical protein